MTRFETGTDLATGLTVEETPGGWALLDVVTSAVVYLLGELRQLVPLLSWFLNRDQSHTQASRSRLDSSPVLGPAGQRGEESFATFALPQK